MVALDRLPTPAEMIAHLDRHVAGQERAKRLLAAAVYRHYLGLAYRDLPDSKGRDLGRQHVLLLGPTGCGKTFLVRTLAAHLGVPVAMVAATSLVETGYVGDHVDSVLAALHQLAGGDVARAERGIVFLDEFDKLRRVVGHGRDVSGEGVQNALLALLDGGPVRFKVREQVLTLDTSRILFVCTGAFADLPEAVRRRLAKRAPLGFGGGEGAAPRMTDADALAAVTTQDLIEYGFIPELMGRFATIAPLHPLAKSDLAHILGGVEDSALSREVRQFALHGVRLDVADDAREALAERAMGAGTGARGLASLLRGALDEVSWRLPDLAAEGVSLVSMNRGSALGEEPLTMVHGQPVAPDGAPAAEDLRVGALQAPAPSEVRASRLMEEITRLDHGALAARVRQLHADNGRDRLAGEGLAAWQELESREAPTTLVWVLEEMKGARVDLPLFAEALQQADTTRLSAVLHFASYLRERRKHERGRDQKRPRPPRRHVGDNETLPLEL